MTAGRAGLTVHRDHARGTHKAPGGYPDQRGVEGGTIEPLLTATDVARVLGVRPKRVYELGIPAVKISPRSLRWAPSDLEAWIASRRTAV